MFICLFGKPSSSQNKSLIKICLIWTQQISCYHITCTSTTMPDTPTANSTIRHYRPNCSETQHLDKGLQAAMLLLNISKSW